VAACGRVAGMSAGSQVTKWITLRHRPLNLNVSHSWSEMGAVGLRPGSLRSGSRSPL
jgi:hypothetical protein